MIEVLVRRFLLPIASVCGGCHLQVWGVGEGEGSLRPQTPRLRLESSQRETEITLIPSGAPVLTACAPPQGGRDLEATRFQGRTSERRDGDTLQPLQQALHGPGPGCNLSLQLRQKR